MRCVLLSPKGEIALNMGELYLIPERLHQRIVIPELCSVAPMPESEVAATFYVEEFHDELFRKSYRAFVFQSHDDFRKALEAFGGFEQIALPLPV